MIILGIDQGIANCGYTVLEYRDNEWIYKTSGTIKTTTDYKTEERLKYIYNNLRRVVEEYQVTDIVTERLYGGRYTGKRMMTINMITGIIHLLAAFNNATITQLSPKTIKKKITSNGKANKEEVQEEVEKILNHKFKTDHESDSAAIALSLVLK